MPKIQIPKIVRPLRLADYAPEYGDAVIQVWVNPPRALVEEYREALELAYAAQSSIAGGALEEAGQGEALRQISAAGERIIAWMAQIWSQGYDAESHWTAAEVQELVAHSEDRDPGLWPWLSAQTRNLILEHRTRAKKV